MCPPAYIWVLLRDTSEKHRAHSLFIQIISKLDNGRTDDFFHFPFLCWGHDLICISDTREVVKPLFSCNACKLGFCVSSEYVSFLISLGEVLTCRVIPVAFIDCSNRAYLFIGPLNDLQLILYYKITREISTLSDSVCLCVSAACANVILLIGTRNCWFLQFVTW